MSVSDWKRGAAGRSRVRRRKGEIVVVVSADGSKRRRSEADDVVMVWDSILSRPRKVALMMEEEEEEEEEAEVADGRRREWRLWRNQERKSTGSACVVRVKRFRERSATEWRISWGET